MPCLPVVAELCQVTQCISGENQPELVREPANPLPGKLSKDRRPGKAVMEWGALLGLGHVSCCSLCLWVQEGFQGAEGGTTVARGDLHRGCLTQPENSVNIDIFESQFKISSLQQPQAFQACGSALAANSSAQQLRLFSGGAAPFAARERRKLWAGLRRCLVSYGAGGPQHFCRGGLGKVREAGGHVDMREWWCGEPLFWDCIFREYRREGRGTQLGGELDVGIPLCCNVAPAAALPHCYLQSAPPP